MSKSLAEEFKVKYRTNLEEVSDYEIFPDKLLLESLRKNIIASLVDREIPKDTSLNDFINEEIEKGIEGYDLTNLERSHIYSLIDEEINGFGPLTKALEDDNVSEIMVNSPKEIYVEIDGKLEKDANMSFINEEHIIRTIQKLIQPLGRTIDARNPMVDSRLPDGSRINAVIPPLSVSSPVITIRKFKKTMTSIDDLIRLGTLTPYMARFLEAAVSSKLNILISGGTGTGKSTLLNILSSFISEDERIITIEDAAELKLNQKHVISLETKPNSYDNDDEVTIQDLVINSLRMRPDRIIVGEVRGKEAFDMLQAMNTGHDGSLTTIHANSCIDALNRLETLVLMGGMDLPVRAVREYIVNAIDIVVNIERTSDGKRKVDSICEIVGIDKGTIVVNEIFSFVQKGITEKKEVDGEFILHENVPKVYQKMLSRGIEELDDMFGVSSKTRLSTASLLRDENRLVDVNMKDTKEKIKTMTREEIIEERKRLSNLPDFIRAKELDIE